jgi:sialidase-1
MESTDKTFPRVREMWVSPGKGLAMRSKGVEILTITEASEDHPRHGGADFIELSDGSIFLAKMLIYKSKLRNQAGDDAPSDVVAFLSKDGGRNWVYQRTLVKPSPNETAAYSPGFLRLRDGRILFRYEMYHRFVQNEPMCISAYVCWSRDECQTFSAPVAIWSRSSHHGGSQGDLRQLTSGRIIVPVMYIEGTALQDDGKGLAPSNLVSAGCFYSDDDGKRWRECASYAYLPMRGAMEPKIEELKDGRLLMVMRNQLGSVFQSHSEDGGVTWSKPQTTGLRAPESCPGLLRIPQTGDLLLIWNDSPYDPKFDHYGVRSPLSLSISKDEGRTWRKSKAIETDPQWEFTNPAAIVMREGKLLITYEASKYASMVHPGSLGRSRMNLKLAIVDLDWLYE